jgi:molecular chaperone DnaK
MADTIVGIDLGTTFSVVAHLDGQGRPVTVPNADGDLTTPSVVFLDKGGAVVGKEAVKAAEFEPDRIARYPKRDMGRNAFHHPVRGELLPPEVLQALILRKLKHDAELKLGKLSKAVITVPAYFNEPRRKATQDAGRMAGWDVVDIINEPTAAAIAFGVQRGFLGDGQAGKPETVLVYDLGGGTFDVTLMRIERNCFTVLATAGDVELGGIDWDGRIIDFVAEEFAKQHNVDPRKDPAAAQRLRAEAEDAKRSLSTRPEVTIAFAHDGRRLRVPLARTQLEAMTGDLLDRTAHSLRRLMRDANLTFTDLTRLLVVGGATRMPMIATLLEKETGLTIDRSLSADEAVAHGAAIYAGAASRPGTRVLRVRNVNSHDLGVLGVEKATGLKRRHVMIARNTPLPATAAQRFPTYRDNQRAVTVSVVEGGDAGGTNATHIGQCVVKDLPPNLPKNTPIEVTFTYAENGRLDVRAAMPTIGKTAALIIERATGMPEDAIAAWTRSVSAGLPDGYIRPGGPAPAPAPPPAAKPAAAPAPATATEPNPFDFRAAPKVPLAIPVTPKPAAAKSRTAAKSSSVPTMWEDEKPPAPTPTGKASDNPFKFG